MIKHGKYANKTFADVRHMDPSYCNWVSDLEDPSDNFKEFQSYLRKHKCTKIMTRGKHTGKTFTQIRRNHKSYCTWVSQLDNLSGCMKKLSIFLKQ